MSQMDPHAQALPDSRWARFRLVAIFAVLIVSVGSWWLYSKGRENPPAEPVELRVLSLKELYPEALSIARDWHPDAFLSWASFTIVGSNQTARPRATFSFWGPSSAANRGLNVYIRGIPPDLEIDTDEAEFPPERPLAEPIDPNELPFDSVDALEIILASGAEEFLRVHPNQPWPPTLILEHSGSYLSEGPLRWRAYFKGDDIHDTEYFKIDAYTGELLD